MAEFEIAIEQRKYLVQEKIASGGHAEVFRALVDSKTVAVKRFFREIASFAEEVRVLQSLKHPNISQLIDAGVGMSGGEEKQCIVMEYIAGVDLKQYCQQQRNRGREVLIGLIIHIAEIIHYAHTLQPEKVIHRDLKPSNILITATGRPYVLDFGIAKMTAAENASWSKSTGIHGTLQYMAPEQHLETAGSLKESCDIWALGVMLHEILEGQPPFTGRTPMALGEQVCNNPHPPLTQSRDKKLQKIVDKALAKKPQKRYADAKELAEALSQYLRERFDGGALRLQLLSKNLYQRAPDWPGLREKLEKCTHLKPPVIAPKLLVIGPPEHPAEVWLGFAKRESKNSWWSRRQSETITLRQLQGTLAEEQLLSLGEAIIAAINEATRLGLRPDIPDKRQIYQRTTDGTWEIDGHQWPYAVNSKLTGAAKLAKLLRDSASQEVAQQWQELLKVTEQQSAGEWWRELREELAAQRQLPRMQQWRQYLLEGTPEQAVEAARQLLTASWGSSSTLSLHAGQILVAARPDRDGKVEAVVELAFDEIEDHERLLAQWQQRHPDGEERMVYVLRNALKTAITPVETPVAQVAIPGFKFLRQMSYSCGGASRTVEEYVHKETGMEFALLPGGEFMMGSPDSDDMAEDWEKPQHRVTVQPFLIARYPVTQEQWRQIVKKYRDEFKDVGAKPSHFKGAKRPVEQVSWLDCYKFAEKTGLYLPSEAQWEYACRAGTTTRFYWGDEVDGAYLWYDKNAGSETHPVGEKKPNAFGLYDMSGNVWEWCADEWHGNYRSAPIDGSVWGELNLQPASLRVRRGGRFANVPRLCRSACRGWSRAGGRWYDLGVRFSRPPRP